MKKLLKITLIQNNYRSRINFKLFSNIKLNIIKIYLKSLLLHKIKHTLKYQYKCFLSTQEVYLHQKL